jgi:hypothetical protein
MPRFIGDASAAVADRKGKADGSGGKRGAKED